MIILISAVLSTTAVAAESRASTYFSDYDASVSTSSSGTVTIRFDVTGMSSITQIGALSISLYKADGTYVKTFNSSTYTNMLASGTGSHSSSVIHLGEAGQSYYAVVTFYAKNSSGSDTVTYTTNVG